MRRPLLLVLLAQIMVIVFLYFLDPFGLGTALLPKSSLAGNAGSVCAIEGTALKAEARKGYIALTVRTNGEQVLIRLKADPDLYNAYDLAGRRVTAAGELSLPDERRNPGCFDYRLYLKGRRVFTIMEVSRFRLEAGDVERPLLHFLSGCKGRFYGAIRPLVPDEEFQLIAGLLFGDTSYMSEDLYEEFRLTGMAHVLAVSGLHVGLLYAIVLKIFRGRHNWITTSVSAALLFAYAALSSFSVSVLRASMMIALNMLAWHLRRRYDLTNAATLTAIVFLSVNPYQLFDSGLQLSFCAAYTMGAALPWARLKGIELSDKYKKKCILKAFEILSPAFMVQLGMTPLILFHFTSFSPVAILVNPIAVLLAGLLLPAGLVVFLISQFFAGIPLIIAAKGSGILAELLILLAKAGQYALPGRYVPALPLAGTLVYYAFFFWFFSETRVTLNRRKCCGAVLAAGLGILLTAALIPRALGLSENFLPWRHDVHAVTFLDVGQGDCIHINVDGYNILVDGGGSAYTNVAERTLRPYLLKNGIDHVDLALVTHKDQDHSLGIEQLEKIFDVRRTVYLGEANEDCGICLIEAGGVRFLLMSDADIAREELLCVRYGEQLACDVLKVGHHGSPYSTGETLLGTARPVFAVISCGRNNIYGHPADRVVELLSNSGIIYARTDESGAVYLKEADEGLLIFENASKSRKWLIQRTTPTRNIPQRP